MKGQYICPIAPSSSGLLLLSPTRALRRLISRTHLRVARSYAVYDQEALVRTSETSDQPADDDAPSGDGTADRELCAHSDRWWVCASTTLQPT